VATCGNRDICVELYVICRSTLSLPAMQVAGPYDHFRRARQAWSLLDRQAAT